MASGFGRLYSSVADAERLLGGRLYASPLGDVQKTKENGEVKHRVIQDLKASRVNALVALEERQVLPRPLDHASSLCDLLRLARERGLDGTAVEVAVIDFTDAFMAVPLDPAEWRHNAARVP